MSPGDATTRSSDTPTSIASAMPRMPTRIFTSGIRSGAKPRSARAFQTLRQPLPGAVQACSIVLRAFRPQSCAQPGADATGVSPARNVSHRARCNRLRAGGEPLRHRAPDPAMTIRPAGESHAASETDGLAHRSSLHAAMPRKRSGSAAFFLDDGVPGRVSRLRPLYVTARRKIPSNVNPIARADRREGTSETVTFPLEPAMPSSSKASRMKR